MDDRLNSGVGGQLERPANGGYFKGTADTWEQGEGGLIVGNQLSLSVTHSLVRSFIRRWLIRRTLRAVGSEDAPKATTNKPSDSRELAHYRRTGSPKTSHVDALSPSTSECGLICKQGLSEVIRRGP